MIDFLLKWVPIQNECGDAFEVVWSGVTQLKLLKMIFYKL